MWKGTYFGKIEGHMIVPLSFFITISSHGIRGIFDQLKNLTKHFVCWNCLISSLCSHKTDEPGWILTFVWGFTICPCIECYFGKSKMVSPSWVTMHPCHHAFAMQKLRWLWCSHCCVNFAISAKILTSSTSRKIIWCGVNISNGNIGLLWTITTTNLTKWLFLIKFNV